MNTKMLMRFLAANPLYNDENRPRYKDDDIPPFPSLFCDNWFTDYDEYKKLFYNKGEKLWEKKNKM